MRFSLFDFFLLLMLGFFYGLGYYYVPALAVFSFIVVLSAPLYMMLFNFDS